MSGEMDDDNVSNDIMNEDIEVDENVDDEANPEDVEVFEKNITRSSSGRFRYRTSSLPNLQSFQEIKEGLPTVDWPQPPDQSSFEERESTLSLLSRPSLSRTSVTKWGGTTVSEDENAQTAMTLSGVSSLYLLIEEETILTKGFNQRSRVWKWQRN